MATGSYLTPTYSRSQSTSKSQDEAHLSEVEALKIKNSALLRDLEEVMESRDEKAKENAGMAAKLEHMDKELKHAKEALSGVRGSQVVKLTDSWPACHEFEPSTTEDQPCRVAMYVKSVKSSNVLFRWWCGMEVKRGECQLRYHPCHLTMVKKRGPSPKALV
ncbi:uncharacterized protein TNCV_127261 [Trichonephila clavipes]|nr:uncharacterized protein TNCV_127261 [Trichonephila clavipes]